MYEIHGWFVLSPAANDEPCTEADLAREVELVRPLVDAVAEAQSPRRPTGAADRDVTERRGLPVRRRVPVRGDRFGGPSTLPQLSITGADVTEGDGPGLVPVTVRLSKPSATPVTAWVQSVAKAPKQV